jgi:hypothetical protein
MTTADRIIKDLFCKEEPPFFVETVIKTVITVIIAQHSRYGCSK